MSVPNVGAQPITQQTNPPVSSTADKKIASDKVTSAAASVVSTTATATAAGQAAPSVHLQTLSTKELSTLLADTAVEAIQRIVQDKFTRMQEYAKDIKQLAKGIFYANSYAEALVDCANKIKERLKAADKPIEETSAEKWLNFYIKNGNFYKGLCPNKFFSHIAMDGKPTGCMPGAYVINKDIKPSDALKALQEGLTFLGCGETTQVAYYEAILKALGKEKFDALFNANTKTPLSISQLNELNPIKLLQKEVLCKKIEDIKRGEISYIRSLDQYPIKHLNGEASGFFNICLVEGAAFKVLALGLKPEGSTPEQVTEELLREYNKPPIDESILFTKEVSTATRSAETAESIAGRQRLKTHTVALKQFKKMGGGRLHPVKFTFDVERIELLRTARIEQCKILLEHWQQQHIDRLLAQPNIQIG